MAEGGSIPEYPTKRSGAVLEMPWVWAGDAAIDGAVGDWALAPLGSQYTRVNSGNVTFYVKKAKTSVTGDWKAVTTA